MDSSSEGLHNLLNAVQHEIDKELVFPACVMNPRFAIELKIYSIKLYFISFNLV